MNYLKIYFDLVDKRIKEPATENIEKHHIIPKSLQKIQLVLDLFKNYKVGQLVNLTYREHYITHCLLVKIFRNIDNNSYFKMLNAFMLMSYRMSINSRMYESFKKNYVIFCSEKYSGEGNPMYGVEYTEERRTKQSNTMKDRYKDPENIEKNRQAQLKWWEEHPEAKKGTSIFWKQFWKEHPEKHVTKFVKGNIPWNKGLHGENNPQSGSNHPTAIRIVRISKDGEVKHYDYMELATAEGFSKIMIHNCIKNYKTNYIAGKKFDEYYIWLPTKYYETLSDEVVEEMIKELKTYYKKGMPKIVVKIDIDNNSIIKTYDSVTDCGKEHNVSRTMINKYISSEKIFEVENVRYKLMYKNEYDKKLERK